MMRTCQIPHVYGTCNREHSSATFDLPGLRVTSEGNGRRMTMVHFLEGLSAFRKTLTYTLILMLKKKIKMVLEVSDRARAVFPASGIYAKVSYNN